jgi:hypothetical protein
MCRGYNHDGVRRLHRLRRVMPSNPRGGNRDGTARTRISLILVGDVRISPL